MLAAPARRPITAIERTDAGSSGSTGAAVDRIVLQQHHGPGRHGAGQRAGLVVGHHAGRRIRRGPAGVGAQLGREEPDAGPLHHVPRGLARFELAGQVLGPLLAERLLEVHPRVQRRGRVAQARR